MNSLNLQKLTADSIESLQLTFTDSLLAAVLKDKLFSVLSLIFSLYYRTVMLIKAASRF